MIWKKKSSKIISILILFFVFSCKSNDEKKLEGLPYYNEATYTPHWLKAGDVELKNFHKIPAFSFLDQDGKNITDKTFDGKIYVTSFFFTTCPGICPKMKVSLSTLQDYFKNDDQVLLLSHSVTPEADSVSVLKEYAIKNGINSKKWHLVTGNRKEIYNLGRKFYFAEEDLGEERSDEAFLHTENFVLVDKNKHIRGIYNGLNKASVNQLIADVKTLEKE